MNYSEILESWVGVPYSHQGHSRSGCDCIGLLRGVGAELGVDYSRWDVPDRPYMPHPRLLIRGLSQSHLPNPDRVCGLLSVAILPDVSGMRHHVGLVFRFEGILYALEADRELGAVQIRAVIPPPPRHWYQAQPDHKATAMANLTALGSWVGDGR